MGAKVKDLGGGMGYCRGPCETFGGGGPSVGVIGLESSEEKKGKSLKVE